MVTSDSRGALSLPLAYLLMAAAIAGLGTWGLMRHWRKLVETQLRLDRCVGTTAQGLKSTLETLGRSNRRMRRERKAAMAATVLAPEAVEAIRTIEEFEFGLQEALKLKWEAQQALWLARGGCGDVRDFALPLPSLSWTRGEEDIFGPQPFEWDESVKKDGVPDFHIRLRHAPRVAASRVRGDERDETEWKAQWAGFY